MRKLSSLLITGVAAALAACGGSDNTLVNPGAGDGDGSGGGGDGGGNGGGSAPIVTVRMGSGFGGDFQPQSLDVAVGTLSAGGSTNITATFVTPTGNLYTEDVTVMFDSPCIAQDLATITTPVETSTGVATATYTASGCSGTDEVTAVATVEGSTITASGIVNVAPAAVGSIQFISAEPTNIGLKGMGGIGRSESSTLNFRVLDQTGEPVRNAEVQFELNTEVGGLKVHPGPQDPPALTTSDGHVQAYVASGNRSTPVRVTATVLSTAPRISTQSDALTVTTGIPDSDSVSLSVETFNAEGWLLNGTTVAVTVHLADRYNNPVPDQTSVIFYTTGGSIDGDCLTERGACSVTWVSQAPRPDDGIARIIAIAIGEESFVDRNDNSIYDELPQDFDDIGEPFIDENDNGTRDPWEWFYDFNDNQLYDPPNGLYDGPLCDSDVCGDRTVAVFETTQIVMSDCALRDVPDRVTVNEEGTTLPIIFEDLNGLPLPAGTSISFDTKNGVILSEPSFEYPNTMTPVAYKLIVAADNESSSGPLFIDITCPSGRQEHYIITIDD